MNCFFEVVNFPEEFVFKSLDGLVVGHFVDLLSFSSREEGDEREDGLTGLELSCLSALDLDALLCMIIM